METPDPIASTDAALQEQEGTTLVIGSQGRKTRHTLESIRPYDFRQPAFLAPAELRKLRLRHEDFVRSLSSRLSMYLRLEVSLKMSKLQTIGYQTFTEAVSTPAHLTLFKAEPLKGIGLLAIPPRLGLSIVDRLLGGAARTLENNRELTEIETALLDQAVQIILNEWCNHWQAFQDLRPTLLGHESNGRFLQTAPHDTVMVCVTIDMGLGATVEQMQLAFPHYTIEPIVKYLTALSIAEKETAANVAIPQACWNSELDDVAIGVSAKWSGLQLTARELIALKPGDVLMLDSQMTQQAQIHIASAAKYNGRLGTCGNNWAVELTQPLNN